MWSSGGEGRTVFEIIFFDGPPVGRIHQLESVGGAVGIIHIDNTVGNLALHGVGGSRHQEPGMFCLPAQPYRYRIRVVVPQRGENNIVTAGGSSERYPPRQPDLSTRCP